uniref:Genome polyprotein n=3 Tax=Lettuce mosaic virus TaxID=12202 RepID=A0A0A7CCW2_9POTV|nr:polyprotein [Lettuce mosaic virus]
MATLDNCTQVHHMFAYNREHGTNYTRNHFRRHLAAQRIGFYYDWDDDVYECPTCEAIYHSLDEIKNWHECDPPAFDLNDFITDARLKSAPIPDLGPVVIETPKVEEKQEFNFFAATPAPEVTQWKCRGLQFGSLTGPETSEPVVSAPEPDREEPVRTTTKPEESVGQETCGDGKRLLQVQMEVDKVEQDLAFTRLNASLKPRLEGRTTAIIARRRDGCLVYKTKPSWSQRKRTKKTLKVDNLAGKNPYIPAVVDKISIAGGSSASVMCEQQKPKILHTTPSRKVATHYKRTVMNQQTLTAFINQVGTILLNAEKEFEVVGYRKQKVTGKGTRHNGVRLVKLKTAHEEGHRRRVDIRIPNDLRSIVMRISARGGWHKTWTDSELSPGSSGYVLNSSKIIGKFGLRRHNIFVVRGRVDGEVIDSQSKVTHSITHRMVQYSDVARNFWNGYSTCFMHNTPKDILHTCTSDFDVKECGTVAALLTQTLFQFGKITCEKCAIEYKNLTRDELATRVNKEIDGTIISIQTQYPRFVHVLNFLKLIKQVLNAKNENFGAFQETEKIIGDRMDAPFSHVNKLNTIVIKGNQATSDEMTQASNHVLEIARYLKNRTENIQKGSLKSFRNKISGKAHLNPSLMCDNQLDKNGGFEWGQRSYHAKRFFDGYFETIDPSDGYSKYTIRRNPNGHRKLAIGNLIVSTNFESHRRSMIGESIEDPGLTNQCVSKERDAFIYPCCCVTDEYGKPTLSEIKMPTKHHLVLGNAGDPKYVDLPKEAEGKMFVTKDGYCYINIFLAMLIDVPEDQAKDFTKMAREIAVKQLGEWPSMMDVATACNILATFHPDTRRSELPRILVDHATKTFHVIDSYGSITTGFHILKANTVTQLVKFAHESLESEMQHYRVGGEPDKAPKKPAGSVPTLGISDLRDLGMELENEEHSTRPNLQRLIKAIYRPRMMRSLLTEEPYLLILSIVSPGVLMALYNSGSLERTMHEFLQTDHKLSAIAQILKHLAKKVSLARTLTVQNAILEDGAGSLNEILDAPAGRSLSYRLAKQTVEVMMARSDMDKELVNVGFSVLRDQKNELIEKSYLMDLEDSWHALPLCGKLSAMRASRRWRDTSTPEVTPTGAADLKGRYSISVGSVSKSAISHLKGICSGAVKRVRDKWVGVQVQGVKWLAKSVHYMIPELTNMVNVGTLLLALISLGVTFRNLTGQFKEMKHRETLAKEEDLCKRIRTYNSTYYEIHGKCADAKQITKFITHHDPKLLEVVEFYEGPEEEEVEHQAKREDQANLERIIAFTALVMMMFDCERSDCVYRSLSKLKSLVSTCEDSVRHQSVDEIIDLFDEKKQMIDFEIEGKELYSSRVVDSTFSKWWDNQLARGNTMAHYRTEGYFMTFTRETAASVAAEIAHNEYRDILLQGGVGSGKSTGLPFHLHKKGGVLLIEPTRPLAQNVYKQLGSSPFHLSPNLRMRGSCKFGSSQVTVATSGYALHFIANNAQSLKAYDFIIFDECHVLDASAMAFRCLLQEFEYQGKIIKVSATPPGRKLDFKPMHMVDITTENELSIQQFVQGQGTGVNCDATKKGDNILVYVSSYNEVDMLSKMLNDKGYKVTKVDGRTMKLGGVEVETVGTPQRKHFVVATNIIENGVTLDVDVVVDFGQKVVPILDSEHRMVRYTKKSITYGERIQRVGRVGRNKAGSAIRIGSTEMGTEEIPASIATEAAFLCFTYGLPVMTSNVSTSVLGNCTVRQARTMQKFELSPFFMVDLVHHDGTVHPAINSLLRQFKLKESDITLSTLAIPNAVTTFWKSAREYNTLGARTTIDDAARIPFMIKDVPEHLQEKLWETIQQYKGDAGFGRCTSANACKIAYTLSVSPFMIPATINKIDALMAEERQKMEYFQTVTANTCTISNFSISSIGDMIRSRYSTNHSRENLQKLQAVRDTIINFECQAGTSDGGSFDMETAQKLAEEYGCIDVIYHQSKEALSKRLGLKGRWNQSLICKDLLIFCGVAIGGTWMMFQNFKDGMADAVRHQGKGKRQRQKLRYRQARDNKVGIEVYGDDATMEHYFGAAYTEKGKKSGKTKGMGTKNRRFVNMYGYNPEDFSFIRFLDPLTGKTMDEQVFSDISLVQDAFSKERFRLLSEGEIESEHMRNGIRAYLVKNLTTAALEIDMTPHNSCQLGIKTNNIAGFVDREYELRQTGEARVVAPALIPKDNPITDEDIPVKHESKTLFRGLRDYNPIAAAICLLTNESDGMKETMYGIGFGNTIITNQHLFRRNNGMLRVQSRHGEYVLPNTTQLKVLPCEGRDIMVIILTPDFPPFPQKLKFRPPIKGEKICLVGSLFQDKSITSTVSETSVTTPVDNSFLWKHWITTKDGHCGLPLVSSNDGYIVGIHSATSSRQTQNYHAAMPEDFHQTHLIDPASKAWVKHWKYNPDNMVWGGINLINSTPREPFKINKLVTDLFGDAVQFQSKQDEWFASQLKGNLKAVGKSTSQLVTKHTVKGKCMMFELYLQTHEEEKEFFKPLMGAYQKSRLNREAFTKDIMKYSTPITVGIVDCDTFLKAEEGVIKRLERLGFSGCEYVTDEEAIFQALNMKAAVGALYSGKKRDYFEGYGPEEKENILRESCKRLYTGKFGVWNGSLKSELRPMEKVMANKTRVFTAAPLDTLLAGKVCVDDFNNYFYSKNIEAPWTVGMTKFYGGWNELLTKLPDGWVYCDADGSQFDSSLSPFLINSVLRIRLKFMEDWDLGEQMLKNLYTEIVYTAILTPDSTIVKKFKGNNSGQPSTVVDNTLMVVLAMTYTLHKLGFKDEEQDSMCKYFVNGDDLIIAIKPEHESLLDQFQHCFKSLGLNYDFNSRTRKKEELWFMSHCGIKKDGIFIPKLEPERIVSILEWDRSDQPVHRLEAICAAMIESWGYDKLTHEIRKFYKWCLEQVPYADLAKAGKAPYIAECALKRLYTSKEASEAELEKYMEAIRSLVNDEDDDDMDEVYHQVDAKLDAGQGSKTDDKQKNSADPNDNIITEKGSSSGQMKKDDDINAGLHGKHTIPRTKAITQKMKLPMIRGKVALNLDHLLEYEPNQRDISNTRATQKQYESWYDGVKNDYDVDDSGMQLILNGLMVWCIENGTSPNINGTWVMMDGEEQVEYALKPIIEHAKPTFRQIMAHFSDAAEAYIEMRNKKKPYMPRYGRLRGLNDMGLARYAFDFYETTSATPNRAREAHNQMKAAALVGTQNRLFGMDGGGSTQEENTERHTAADVNQNMHTLLGVRGLH